MIKKVLIFGLLFCNISSLQAIIAIGDTPNAPTTFQFAVGSAIYDSTKQQLWTLSGQDTSSLSATVQSYGISYTPSIPVDAALLVPEVDVAGNVISPVNLVPIKLTSYPYLSTQAVITTTDGQGALVEPGAAVANPLLGQNYSGVTFATTFLTVINALAPRYVYMIQSVIFNDGKMYGTTSPAGTSIINQLDLGVDVQANNILGIGSLVFIANAQGTFGTDASNISFATISNADAIINGQITTCSTLVKQFDAPVTTATSVLTANGNDLAAIGSSVALYKSPNNLQSYVGLDVRAGAAAGSQAVGLFAATAVLAVKAVAATAYIPATPYIPATKNKPAQAAKPAVPAQPAIPATPASMTFSSVIPDAVASFGLATPVSAPQANQVVVSNISSTVTSTGLSYFITSRYDGLDAQYVYAMPMVTMASTASDNGMIADFDSIAQTFKTGADRLQGFDTVISDANQINITGSADVVARLQVGAGAVPLNPGQFINQLAANGDAIFITIQTASAVGSMPGMFKSQALFDAQGRIMSWSPWQRVAGTDDQMVFAVKNYSNDATMYVSGAPAAPSSVTQTRWNNAVDLTSFIAALNSAMPVTNGGVQGLLTVSNQTSGLSDMTLAVAMGNEAVVIAQTGSLTDNQIVVDDVQATVTIDSSLNLNIGSVVAATFASNGANNWFFMGGDSGLSVLSNDTTGITFTGNLTDLTALTAIGMSCKTLGNFTFIKKLASDNNFLYVLTLQGVYRIALTSNKFTLASPAALDVQLVVSASTINQFASCTDMLVDNNVMLLGTTDGLYSLDVSGGLPATPVWITIPQGLPTVSRMVTISNDADFYTQFYASSNLYVLSIDYGTQQARLNRFTITNGVVTPIQDQIFQGQNGPLLIFAYMSNNIFIDGSIGFATAYPMGKMPSTFKYLQSALQGGRANTVALLSGFTVNLSIASVVSSLGLTAVARDYASGCLMLAADFGLLTDS